MDQPTPTRLVEFLPAEPGPACPLCDHPHSQRRVRARHFHAQGEWVVFYRCAKCQSLFSQVHGNAYAGQLPEGFIKFYVELGAGVEPIAQMVLENLPRRLRSYADVGCALGYSLDFVSRVHDIPVLGLEPNPMQGPPGLRGDILPRPLDAAWLAEDTRRFDLVLASEVIEHVDDPVAFARCLRGALADEFGVVVFSTPDAHSIEPGESDTEVFSRLFPGEHRFLFTLDMLRTVLSQAGFEAIEVQRRGGHLIASAGTRAALAGRQQRPLGRGWISTYQDYLRAAIRELEADPGSPVYSGHAYRLFKSLMNQGKAAQARDWLAQAAPLRPWLDAHDLLSQATIDQALTIDSFEAYVRQLPSFGGPLAYHLAMLARIEGRFEDAAIGLERAVRLMTHEIHLAPFCFIEAADVIDVARRELALVAQHLSRPEQAWAHWMAMAQDAGTAMRRFAQAGARLALEANARADYAGVERVVAALRAHPMQSEPLLRALWHGDLQACAPEDLDLAFDFWVARFYAALHGPLAMEHAQHAHLMLSCELERLPDARRLAKLTAVRQDLVALRQRMQPRRAAHAARLVHFIDQMWCDLHGVFVKGWVHASGHRVQAIQLECAGHSVDVRTYPRPDVLKFYPEFPESGDTGFAAYLACPPFQPLRLQVDIGGPVPLSTVLEVPPHLQAPPAAPHPTAPLPYQAAFLEEMKRLGGTVLVLGGRLGESNPDRWADCLLPECRVLRVDIHPGPGVDVVADAHELSRHFAAGSVDAVISHSVLEHLQAPWVVAAEVNRVLRPGGLTMHHAPLSWPLHAAPNDFWRFSDEGLKTLFGPATGFEILDCGLGAPTRMYPAPALRQRDYASIEMPVFDGYLSAYLLARKTATLTAEAVQWPGVGSTMGERARQYPKA